MRIAIDMSSVLKAEPSGIAQYALRLSEHLAAGFPSDQIHFLYRASRLKKLRYLPKKGASNIRHGLLTPGLLRPRHLDVFHGPDARLEKIDCPKVATIHDVFSTVSQGWADERFRAKKNEQYHRIASEADRIIVPTENTKRDLESHFESARGRIRVIPHGVDKEFHPRSEQEIEACCSTLKIPRPYLLFLGLISTRKNCVRMIQAFGEIASKWPEHHFVLAGSPSHRYEETLRAREESGFAERIHMNGFAPKALIPSLYSGASLLCFPTLYEGFGFPILESMACGTPVLASDQNTPREVGGDVPHFVDPESIDSIAEGLDFLLHESQNTKRVEDGLERSRAFTWSQCASRTRDLYRELITR